MVGFFLAHPFGQEGRLLKLALIGFVFSPSRSVKYFINTFHIRHCANLALLELALFFQMYSFNSFRISEFGFPAKGRCLVLNWLCFIAASVH